MLTRQQLPRSSWGVTFKGYMRFDYVGNYTFYFGGEGALSGFWVDGTNYLSANGSTQEKTLHIASTALATTKAYNVVTPGNWKSLEVRFTKYIASEKMNTGIVGLWKTDNAIATPDKVVLSAAVTCPWGIGVPAQWGESIADTALPDYSKVNLNVNEKQGSVFTFEVPFMSSAAPKVSSAGFFYDPISESYFHVDKTGYPGLQLKKYRQINYYEGYVNPSGNDELVQKFSGQIRDFNVNLNSDGQDTLEVVCNDYSTFAREQFNVDAPNPIDYMAAGYLEETIGHVNGKTKPPCFDGWELHKAFSIMAMNSYLDPYHMMLRQKKSNASGNTIYANYNVEPYGLGYQIYLDRDPIKYGNPMGMNPTSAIKGATLPPDAPYLYEVGFGEYYQDAITKITSLYGMDWGVNRYGYPYLKVLGAPRTYADARDVTKLTYSGTWTHVGKDIDSFRAVYSSAQTVWSSVVATFTGSRCEAIVAYHPNGGNNVSGATAGQNATIFAEIRKGGVKVDGTNCWYNTYLATAWHLYNGVYPGFGFNPCVLEIGRNLTYDTYTVHLWRHNNTGKELQFAGFLFYDEDLDGTKVNFRTSDQYAPGQVTDLRTVDTGEDLRNEAYVLGKFVSYQYDLSADQSGSQDNKSQTSIVNPSNPVGQYITSVTRDLNSIFKSTASNFVGMPRRILVQDPSIGSQSQADYLSYNIVKQYANPGKNIDFGSLGNPLVEVNDKIVIMDEYSQAVDSSNSFWVKSVDSQFDETYTTKYDVTSFRPIGSYFPKPQPDIAGQFGGVPLLNLRIENRGVIARLNAALTKTTVNQIQLTTVTGLPPKGYIYLQMQSSGQKVYEIIKYESRDPDGTNPGYIKTLTRGLQYSSNAAWSSGQNVIGAYDPYMQEGTGIVPTIKFDSLVSGKIHLRIMGDLNQTSEHVNTLTGIGSDEWPYESYDGIEWGANQIYTWDCRDAIGKWNQYFHDTDHQEDLKGGAGYYVAEPKDKSNKPQYSQFYLDFQFRDNSGNIWGYRSKEYNRFVSTASIVTRRGPIGKINAHIQYDGCWYPIYSNGIGAPMGLMSFATSHPAFYAGRSFAAFSTAWNGNRYYYINSTSWSTHYIGVDEITQYPRAYLRYHNDGTKNISYRTDSGGYSNMKYVWLSDVEKTRKCPMVHFTSTSNASKGLKFIIRSGGNLYNEKPGIFPDGDNRVQEKLDSDYRRHYSIGLKFRRNVMCNIQWSENSDQPWWWIRILGYLRPFASGGRYDDPFIAYYARDQYMHEKTDGDFIVDESITWDFYNDGKGRTFYFNPKNLTGENTYHFPPIGDAIKGFWDGKTDISRSPSPYLDINKDGNVDMGRDSKAMYFYNYVAFHGEFLDNSGRVPITLGDIFKNPDSIHAEGFNSMVKKANDNSTSYRYDESDRPRVVGYVDFSFGRQMANNNINNLPNLVLTPPSAFTVDAEPLQQYWPPLAPGPIFMWLYKRDGNI
jgi:hypothetical protein